MPVVLNPRHAPFRVSSQRSGPQKVAIILGVCLLVLGFMGVMMPGLMRMHLSVANNVIHIASGILALWCGYTSSSRAFNFCLGFGALYGFLGIAGFVMGEPGYPAFGYMEADQNLFRLIPNVLELGTTDHLLHMLIGAFLIFTSYSYRKDKRPS